MYTHHKYCLRVKIWLICPFSLRRVMDMGNANYRKPVLEVWDSSYFEPILALFIRIIFKITSVWFGFDHGNCLVRLVPCWLSYRLNSLRTTLMVALWSISLVLSLYHHLLFDVLFYLISSLSRCDLLIIEPIKNGSYINVMIKFDQSKQYVAY
jgi:hypothetical protein